MVTASYIADGVPAKQILSKTNDRDWIGEDILVNGQRINDVVPVLDAAYAPGFHRKNKRNIVTIDVMRGIGPDQRTPLISYEQALLFLVDHVNEFPGSGRLLLEFTNPAAVRVFHNALLESIEPRAGIGVSLLLRYTFTCGRVSKALNQ